MSRRGYLLSLGMAFIGLVGLVLWARHGEFWAIDRCLDAGGMWNYPAKDCQR